MVGEELMSMIDFVAMKKVKGYMKEDADTEWQQMIDAAHEGEGDGKARKLWIQENKKDSEIAPPMKTTDGTREAR